MFPETCFALQDFVSMLLVMKWKLVEAGKLSLAQPTNDSTEKVFRVMLINEGKGSSATWPREFFTQENADKLAGALSFPGHPENYERPELRNPLDAIGKIGDVVTVEEHDGKLGFWSTFIPSKSKQGVQEYIEEYIDKLGLSVYSEGDVRQENGEVLVEALADDDPYRSVDIVVAPGRGGKFERVAEALRKLSEDSANPQNDKQEETRMDKDIEERFAKIDTVLETLAAKLDVKVEDKTAELQAQVDAEAVEKAVDERLGDYDKAVELISDAQLTESQSSELRARARKGEDITGAVETAKKVLAEARKGLGNDNGADPHLGGSNGGSGLSFDVPGFGRMVS